MLKRLMNLPFTVASRAARAYQAREDARVREQFGGVDDPGEIGVAGSALRVDASVPAELLQKPAAEILGWLASGQGVELVDVRDAAERAAQGGIRGAVPMPVDTVSVRVSELSTTLPVVVYCADGRRSLDVVRFFRERGMEETWALAGGLAAWRSAGGAVDGR